MRQNFCLTKFMAAATSSPISMGAGLVPVMQFCLRHISLEGEIEGKTQPAEAILSLACPSTDIILHCYGSASIRTWLVLFKVCRSIYRYVHALFHDYSNKPFPGDVFPHLN